VAQAVQKLLHRIAEAYDMKIGTMEAREDRYILSRG
jgi:hypothetical protein